MGVVGKFVEFFGPGVAQLSIADRATIANMCPEYGATAAFFPVDDVSVQYLEQTGERGHEQSSDVSIKATFGSFEAHNPRRTSEPLSRHLHSEAVLKARLPVLLDVGRPAETLAYVTRYLQAVAMFRDYNDTSQTPDFTQVSVLLFSADIPTALFIKWTPHTTRGWLPQNIVPPVPTEVFEPTCGL